MFNMPLALAEVGTSVTTVGAILLAVAAAYAALGSNYRARAVSVLASLLLLPLLLAATVWDSPQLESFKQRPLLLVVAALAAVLLLLLFTVIFQRSVTLMLALIALTLPLRLPIQFGGDESNLLLPLYLMIAAAALALAHRWWQQTAAAEGGKQGRLARVLTGLLAASLLAYAVSATYSTDQQYALTQILFFYVPFMLLYIVLSEVRYSRSQLKAVAITLLTMALLFVAVGFYEYATRRLLLNPKIINANQFDEYFRVSSLFFDPNIYGRFLATVMLGLAAVLLWTKRPLTTAATTVTLLVLLAGLMITFSQSSFAGLTVGLIVIGALRWRARTVVVPAVVITLLAVAVVSFAPGVLRLNLDSESSVNKASSGRLDLVSGGVDLFLQRPLTGYGAGAFADQYRKHKESSDKQVAVASHTTPVTVAAEQGVIGLALYMSLLAVAFTLLLKGARASPLRAYLAAAFAALVVHTQIYAAFLEDPLTWALLAVAVALLSHPPKPAAEA